MAGFCFVTFSNINLGMTKGPAVPGMKTEGGQVGPIKTYFCKSFIVSGLILSLNLN